MEELRAVIAAEWVVIADGWRIFAVAALAIAALVYGAIRWAFQARLENKDSELQLLKTTVDDYRRKLDGASPDQAKDRLDALERRLKFLEPRRLTYEQLTCIYNYARDAVVDGQPVPDAIVYHDGAVADAKPLAAQLGQVLNDAGWKVTDAMAMGHGGAGPHGIIVRSRKPEGIPAQRIAQGLSHAGLQFTFVKDPRTDARAIEAEVDIIVSTKTSPPPT